MIPASPQTLPVPARRPIDQLTGIRGLAAGIVFISHAANLGWLPIVFGEGWGKIGVMMFFMLSGFLMGYLYLHRPPSRAMVGRYVRSRLARVLPLYLLLVVASFLLYGGLRAGWMYAVDDLPTFGMAAAMLRAPGILWTIPVEVQFYAVFVGAWLLWHRCRRVWLLLAYAALSMIPMVVVAWVTRQIPLLFSTYCHTFFIGILLALASDRLRGSGAWRRAASWAAVPLLVLLVINLPEWRRGAGLIVHPYFKLRVWFDPPTLLIVGGLLTCAVMEVRPLRFLASRPMRWMGDISYGFYLLHFPVILLVDQLRLPGVVSLLIAAVLSIALASLSLRFFERPADKLIRGPRQIRTVVPKPETGVPG